MGSRSSVKAQGVIVPPDGGWGWMVLVGSFVAYFIADGWSYSFGVIYPVLLDEFGEGRGKTALIAALLYGIPMLGSPVVCALCSVYGCRPVTIIGGLVTGVSFCLTTLATSFNILCLTSGVLASIGLAMTYIPSIIIVTYYFEKRRGLVTGLAMVGSGLGAFAFPPLMEFLLDQYGWRYTFLILGGIYFNVVACGALFRPPPMKYPDDETEPSVIYHVRNTQQNILMPRLHPSSSRHSGSVPVLNASQQHTAQSSAVTDEALLSKNLNSQLISTTDKSHHYSSPDLYTSKYEPETSATQNTNYFSAFVVELKTIIITMLDRTLASNRIYLFFAAATFLLYLFVGMPYVYLKDKAQLVGIVESKAAFLFSIIGIGRAVGQICLGWLGDKPKIPTISLYAASITVAGLAMLLIPVSGRYGALATLSLIFGFFISVTYTLQMMCLVEMVGLSRATSAFGLYQLVQGIATLLGTPIAGWLYEATLSYDASFYVAGSLVAFSGLILIPLPWMFHHEEPIKASRDEMA